VIGEIKAKIDLKTKNKLYSREFILNLKII